MNINKSSPEHPSKSNQSAFDIHAIELFRKQARCNEVYHSYLDYLGVDIQQITQVKEIPFLPIEFFKQHYVKTNEWQEEKVFESSGTTGVNPSKHFIRDIAAYHTNARQIFENQFGAIKRKTIIGLLPSYLERGASSLVSMVDYFIELSESKNSGFYLNQLDDLVNVLADSEKSEEIYLFGVTFALLDLAEKYDLDLSHVRIIETGGMKGRREEIVKDELYEILKKRLNIQDVYTEYGMTELLSQAYGKAGRMELPSTMMVLIRDINDPFAYLETGKTGGINIIDMANQDSCAFVETKDLGRINTDGSFEILGRYDNSDIRGCNLLVS